MWLKEGLGLMRRSGAEAHLSAGEVQPQRVQDLLQVPLQQVAAVALVEVDKRHQQLLVVRHHLLLLL